MSWRRKTNDTCLKLGKGESVETQVEWLEDRVDNLERSTLDFQKDIALRLDRLERKLAGAVEFIEATSGAWAKFDEWGYFRGWAKLDHGAPMETRREDTPK